VPAGRFCAVCIISGENVVPTVKQHTYTSAVLVTRTKLEQDEGKLTPEGFRLSLTWAGVHKRAQEGVGTDRQDVRE